MIKIELQAEDPIGRTNAICVEVRPQTAMMSGRCPHTSATITATTTAVIIETIDPSRSLILILVIDVTSSPALLRQVLVADVTVPAVVPYTSHARCSSHHNQHDLGCRVKIPATGGSINRPNLFLRDLEVCLVVPNFHAAANFSRPVFRQP